MLRELAKVKFVKNSKSKYIGVVNLVVWLHMLIRSLSVYVCRTVRSLTHATC